MSAGELAGTAARAPQRQASPQLSDWLLLLPLVLAASPSALWSAWPEWLGPASPADPQPMATLSGRLALLAALGLPLVAGRQWAGAQLNQRPLIDRAGLRLLALALLLALRASLWPRAEVPFDMASNLLPYGALLLGLLLGRQVFSAPESGNAAAAEARGPAGRPAQAASVGSVAENAVGRSAGRSVDSSAGRPVALSSALSTGLSSAAPRDVSESSSGGHNEGPFTGRAARIATGLSAVTALASLAALATALWDPALGLAGVLGNSGPSTQLALPGAVTGLALLHHRHLRQRLLGGLAVAGFLAHASLAPALGGLLAFAVAGLALFAAKARQPALRRGARLALIAVFLFATAGLARTLWRQHQGTAEAPTDPAALLAESGELAGIEVRAYLWASAPALYAREGSWLGLSPRAFQSSYEAVRHPRERALSDAASGGPTSVEHLHNDWLQAGFDLGFVLGALALFGGLWIARRAWRGAGAAGLEQAALSAALLGLLVLACQHTPLTRNWPVAWLAGLLSGGLWPQVQRAQSPPPQRLVSMLAALGLLVLAGFWLWPGLGLALQGQRLSQALTQLAAPAENAKPSTQSPSSDPLRFLPPARWDAFAAPLALSLALREERQREPSLALAARLARMQPNQANAQVQVGLAELAAAEPAAARRSFERALLLDPTHSAARFNLLRLLLEFGAEPGLEANSEQLAELLEKLAPSAQRGLLLESQRYGWLPPVAIAHQLQRAATGQNDGPSGAELWSPSAAPSPGLGEAMDGLAEAAPEDSDERATLRSLAHHLWARESMHAGQFEDALRSFRQALRQSRWAGRPGSWLIRAELSAAAHLAGRADEAAAEAPQANEVRPALVPIWVR